jgi:hypothetical protein
MTVAPSFARLFESNLIGRRRIRSRPRRLSSSLGSSRIEIRTRGYALVETAGIEALDVHMPLLIATLVAAWSSVTILLLAVCQTAARADRQAAETARERLASTAFDGPDPTAAPLDPARPARAPARSAYERRARLPAIRPGLRVRGGKSRAGRYATGS